MFRKTKRSAKSSLRKRPSTKEDDDDKNIQKFRPGHPNEDDDEDETTRSLLSQARQENQNKKQRRRGGGENDETTGNQRQSMVHQFESSSADPPSSSDMATRVSEYDPINSEKEATDDATNENTSEGVTLYKGKNETRNKFLAGPLRAPAFIRTTCRFDYQPDVCKDYKETGFCGFGDTCIYLHDRGDTLTGWQLEQQWEEQKKKEREEKEREMERFIKGEAKGDGSEEIIVDADDGIPFACHACRGPFKSPIVTSCEHYFCEKCIMSHFKNDSSCPICGKDTHGVFNHPQKLISKKRRVVGSKGGWDEYAQSFKGETNDES